MILQADSPVCGIFLENGLTGKFLAPDPRRSHQKRAGASVRPEFTRFTRHFFRLSKPIVWQRGAPNPVSHKRPGASPSRTITIFNLSFASLNRRTTLFCLPLLKRWS